MMRVHLRGVVIGVATVLSVVVVVSVFNAIDSSDDPEVLVTRHALSTEDQNEAESLETPRGGPRQRPAGARAGGPGARAGGPGARAGGPGARAGGPGARAGGPGARAGGPGARAGGPGARAGGPGARAGGPGARVGGPGARAGGPGARAGGPGARARSRFGDPNDPPTGSAEASGGVSGARLRGPGARSPAGRLGGARGRGSAQLEVEEETFDLGTEVEDAHTRRRASAGRASGRLSSPGSRARVSAPIDEDEEGSEEKPRSRGRKSKEKKQKEEKKEEEEEKTTAAPKKKEPPYPEWWKASYPRSAVSSLQGQFVGDQPLFPACPSFTVGTSAKSDRFGLVEPPNYMRNSKNPCWFEWSGKKDVLKCLPYFYVAGVAKGATADLFSRVAGHPSVMRGGASTYYWWDRLRYGASKTLKYTREAKRTGDTVTLRDYARELVGKHGKNLTKELLYKGSAESIFGDASPTYLTENTQWDVFEGNEGCSEPRVIAATFIRHIFPQARVIIILRDPVERLYSRFLDNVPYVQEFENATASLFHTFTVQAIQTYRECFARTSVRHCAYNASLFSNAVIRLSEGMYPIFLEDWFRVFPREQILILKYEEYVQDVWGHLIKVFQHLGLNRLDEHHLLKLTEQPVTRKGRTREEEGYMMPETISLLHDFYSPFMLKLADMLDDDKWKFPRQDVLQPRKNLEAHEEGNEDVMPAIGQQPPQSLAETGQGLGQNA